MDFLEPVGLSTCQAWTATQFYNYLHDPMLLRRQRDNKKLNSLQEQKGWKSSSFHLPGLPRLLLSVATEYSVRNKVIAEVGTDPEPFKFQQFSIPVPQYYNLAKQWLRLCRNGLPSLRPPKAERATHSVFGIRFSLP
jgi:hypothetical protein